MSATVTWPRPRSSASTRAACTRPIGPRGLGAELDQPGDVAEAVLGRAARGVRQRDGVADELAVDQDRCARRREVLQVARASSISRTSAAPASERPTTAASSPCSGSRR